MKSEEYRITGLGAGFPEALDATEKFGAEGGLSRKNGLRLRLMVEELLGLLRSIAGEVTADYWLEREEQEYRLCLKADIRMTQEMRKELIRVSTSGENSAAKGFTGKLREMISIMLLPKDDNASMVSLGLMSMGSPGGYRASMGSYEWSMAQYKAAVEQAESGEEEKLAKDELEKSILANAADEIRIGILGSIVEITVFKAF